MLKENAVQKWEFKQLAHIYSTLKTSVCKGRILKAIELDAYGYYEGRKALHTLGVSQLIAESNFRVIPYFCKKNLPLSCEHLTQLRHYWAMKEIEAQFKLLADYQK